MLYIEGLARIEQKFIRRSLDPSPDIKVDYVRIDARRKETRPPDLRERFKPGRYDVYIFGDIDSLAFDEAEMAQLAKSVNAGAGFMMLGGEHSFGAGGYGRTPLADVLPIHIDRFERQNFDEPIRNDLHLSGSFRMMPTPIGLTQSLTQLSLRDKNKTTWSQLPPLDGANRFRDLKPGAQMLAESIEGDPLLVAKDYGAGRVLAFAGDSTWRWWLKGFAPMHRRFWRQTILWLVQGREHGRQCLDCLDRRRYGPGERVEFVPEPMRLMARPSLEPCSPAKSSCPTARAARCACGRTALKRPDSFSMRKPPATTPFEFKPRTTASCWARRNRDFLVYDQDRELENPAADRGALENLAMTTGGRSLAPNNFLSCSNNSSVRRATSKSRPRRGGRYGTPGPSFWPSSAC